MSTFDLKFWEELDKEIPGWMSQQEAEFLVENVQGESYLEIGVAYGKSLRVVRHHFPEMKVMGIDLINHGVDKKVKDVAIHYGDANKLVHKFYDLTIDTLFIDGNHTELGCMSDFVCWYNKVVDGGKILFHDYQRDRNHEGVTLAVDAIMPMLKDFKTVRAIACGAK